MTRYVLDTDMLTLYAQGDAAVGRTGELFIFGRA